MGLTATDGETEVSAWSHRGSTHPVPSLCLLIVMHPKFSTQLSTLLRTLLRVDPYSSGGFSGVGEGRNLHPCPEAWGSSAMVTCAQHRAQHSPFTLVTTPSALPSTREGADSILLHGAKDRV